MHLTVLSMLSTNSLSAFSSATTTAPAQRPNDIRLVREPAGAARDASPASRSAIPKEMPSIAPPRGTLLNIAV